MGQYAKIPKQSKKKNTGGRPEADINFEVVDNLCGIQCTGEEIASVIGVDYDTLNSRIKKLYNKSFSEYFQEKRAGGRASLRRKQFQTALDGNATMLIWLGKQYLDQRDDTSFQFPEGTEFIIRRASEKRNIHK